MIKRILTIFLFLFLATNVFSQKKQTSEQYIKKYYKIAIREMKKHKIPASITLAQGLLESGNGNSNLAKKAKNHFGIKCHKGWKGKKYIMDDDAKDECFRVYNSPEKSFEDHSVFLSKRGRYSFLFTDFATTDYKKWAYGLKKAGYATNPKYPTLLITLIERHHLYKYDRKDFVPEEAVQEDVLVLEEINDETFVLEETNEYIKALMGRNVYYSDAKKGIFIFNRIKTIKAKGRSPIEIAIAFDINFNRLLKYNDLKPKEKFTTNQNVFLQPKRFSGSQKDYMVKPGDLMSDISQMFGIKLSHLYKKNLLKFGKQVQPGEVLNLRRKRKTKPIVISYLDVLQAKRKIKIDLPKKVVQQKVYKTQDQTININIIDKTSKSEIKVEVEKERKISSVNSVDQQVYPKDKYVEKNEKMEKLNDEIPVEKRNGIKRIHIVKQGETMYFISRKYNVSVSELKKLNNLEDFNIKIGQELIISHKQ